MNSNKNILVLLGKSGSGKTTTEKALLAHGIENLVTYTTRVARENEVSGVDYHFISNEEFNKINFDSKFIINDKWKYGIILDNLKKKECKTFVFSPISEIYALDTISSAINKGFNVNIFILNVDRNIRFERLVARGESKESIEKRFDIENKEGDYNYSAFEKFNPIILDTGKLNPDEILESIVKEL